MPKRHRFSWRGANLVLKRHRLLERYQLGR